MLGLGRARTRVLTRRLSFDPMRIAIETTALELDRGGTTRVIVQLLGLLEAEPSVELTRIQHPGNPGSGKARVIVRGLSREVGWFGRTLPKKVERLAPDLLHCTSTLAPTRTSVPMAITIHDAIGWDHPEWLTRANVLQLSHVLPRSVATGAHVITSSQYSAERIADHLNLDLARIHVTPPGVDPSFSPAPEDGDDARLAGLDLGGRFILTVGTLQPRKNVEAAIAAFERVAGEHPDLKLAIAGARGWGYEELLARLAASPAGDRVVALGRVDDAELRTLYRRAECLLFTSRYEGFGFPPLEAMASGSPVISTDNTSLAEAIGDAARVIGPDDTEEIAAALSELLGSSEQRAQLTAAGLAHAATFTPQEFLQKTLVAYEAAIAEQL